MSHIKIPDSPEVGSVWFDDGNLIVIAGHKVFRLYRGLLTHHSPVIKKMLSLSGANTVIDEADHRLLATIGRDNNTTGCAVVHFKDKPQEVEWFLSAFIGHSLSSQFSGDLSALAGILRLATNYKVNSLRKSAVECLERDLRFKADLNLNADELLRPMRHEETGGRWMDGMFPLIDVAITVGVPWLLPIVFWRLQRASLSEILHHPEWKAFPEERRVQFLLCRESARDGTVSPFAVVARLHRDGAAHDATPHDQCTDKFKDALHRAFTRSGPKGVNDIEWDGYSPTSSCGVCKNSHGTAAREVAREAFLALLKQMGLPDLHELMREREQFFYDLNDANVSLFDGYIFCRTDGSGLKEWGVSMLCYLGLWEKAVATLMNK